jgi:WD40 repeat protein
MTYRLLLVDAEGRVTTPQLVTREQREFPGSLGLSVHFRPVRNDLLFESAKVSGQLAYRILTGEGVVRSQLWVEYEVLGPHINVTGRSSDLLFALALITSKWRKTAGDYPAIAATGVLDLENAALGIDHTATVQSVRNTAAKVAAAVQALKGEPAAMIFFPAADADSVAQWSATAEIPNHVHLQPIASLEEALACLGITLEKVYLDNPFRGLEYFGYEHRSIFFGRDPEVRDVVEQLLRREAAGVPGLLVEGASGSGKSSFLRAGVLPVLVNPSAQRTDVEASVRSRPIRDTVKAAVWRLGLLPTGAQESRIAESIRECWNTLPEFAGRLDREFANLDELAAVLRECWPAAQRFVWLIDQFEELFTVGLGDSAVDSLGRFLLKIQADGAWTLVSIRADAVAQLKQHRALRQVFGSNEGQYYLATLTGIALDDVITRPAKAADLTFDMDPDGKPLDQLLREHAYGEKNSLPLLQFTLNELYKRRLAKTLTYAAYQELGGLAGSIASTAKQILDLDTAESERTAHRVFRSLVRVDEFGRAARRYALTAEIAEDPAQARLVARLVEARLCVTDQRDAQAVVAFAHDTLLHTLPALTDWLKQEAGMLQTREQAHREAGLWQQHGRSSDWLATPDKLGAFEVLVAANIPLSPGVRSFINRSRRQVRRTRRIKQTAMCLIALLAVVASISAWVARKKEHEAQYQTAEALKAQLQLLTEAAAERLKDGDLIFARGIVLEVLKRSAAAESPDPAAINVLQEVRANDPARAILAGHSGPVRRVSYSPDGSRILTASLDGTARIWDARTGVQLQVLPVHAHVPNSPGYADIVKTAAYSADGMRILTAAADTIEVWNAHTGARVKVIAGHHQDLQSAAYSPDGTQIVAAYETGWCEFFDSQTGVHLMDLRAPEGNFLGAAFSPDGARIVTAGGDGTARVWDARTGHRLIELVGHQGKVQSASYSPDGRRILTASTDNTARIWNAKTGASLMVLSGHLGQVWFATYSPDGKTIATAATDKTVRVWDGGTGRTLRILSGHLEIVGSVAFSPDGRHLVSGGFESTARTWNLNEAEDGLVVSGLNENITGVALSPDGTRLLTASANGTARVLDAHAGTPIVGLSDSGDIDFAFFSPDGMRILTISDAKGMRIWDARSGSRLLSIPDSKGVTSAAYSPDGTRILAVLDDFRFGIRDASTGKTVKTSAVVHRSFITSAVYSPDATRILTASVDKTVRVWDAKTLAPIEILPHKDFVNEAIYSPDGKLIVTATNDSLAHVWDARTGTEIRVLAGHHAPVASVAFSSDGDRIATGSRDDTVRIWDAHSGIQLAVLSAHGTMMGRHVSYSQDAKRIASVAGNGTARSWSAKVPADWLSQVLWEQAVEADPLSEVQRTVLGIPSTLALLANGALQPSGLRAREPTTPAGRAWACSQYTAAYYDPDRIAPGLEQVSINADIAVPACSRAATGSDSSGQISYQTGRALLAQEDLPGARREFENAVSKGYRAASVDLARLLSTPAVHMLDPTRAASLFAQAWKSGVQIGGFELAALYEYGVRSADGVSWVFQPDVAKAWHWYEEGARRHEPHSLARLAERAERGAIAGPAGKTDALLLEAFSLYCRAAERARIQAWPDGAWSTWRYRRATLARILAEEGMMREVARLYKSILEETPS